MALWQDVTGLVRAIRRREGLPRVMLGMYPVGWDPDGTDEEDGGGDQSEQQDQENRTDEAREAVEERS
eukprot:scaffold789_cov261-Pinguiococcus_pyrenoidosus.AAC.22